MRRVALLVRVQQLLSHIMWLSIIYRCALLIELLFDERPALWLGLCFGIFKSIKRRFRSLEPRIVRLKRKLVGLARWHGALMLETRERILRGRSEGIARDLSGQTGLFATEVVKGRSWSILGHTYEIKIRPKRCKPIIIWDGLVHFGWRCFWLLQSLNIHAMRIGESWSERHGFDAHERVVWNNALRLLETHICFGLLTLQLFRAESVWFRIRVPLDWLWLLTELERLLHGGDLLP